jgi:enamine deaminase RidA (YjgF/YER057c/UK114 family)
MTRQMGGPGGLVEYLNPAGLPRNPIYTQVVAVTGPVRTVYIGMQNAVDASGTIVGQGDIAAQTAQVLQNVQTCLEAAGAAPEHLVHWNIYAVQGQPIMPAVAVFQRWWGDRPRPPANSVVFVQEMTPPEFLVGIDAVAVVPLEA